MERSRWSPNCFVLWQGKIFFEEIWNKFFSQEQLFGVEYLDWCFKSFMVCRMSEINFIWLSYVVQFIYTVIIYKPITYTIYIPILNFFWRENNLIFTRCLNDLHKRFKTWPQKVHELLYLKICLLCFFFKVNRF